MNIVDFAILAILGVGFMLGWYRGFVSTALNLATAIGAWLLSLILYTPLAAFILGRTSLDATLLYFTAGVEKLSDMSVATVSVDELGTERVQSIISTSELPKPIESMMLNNINNRAFADQGVVTLGDYFNQTLINLTISLISFLTIYLFIRIICMFAIAIANRVKPYPILKKYDRTCGGGAGVLHAIIVVLVIFSILPIVVSILPSESGVYSMIQSSFFGRLFFNVNLIFKALKSVL